MRTIVSSFCAFIFLLAGCSATSVILMPDEDGKVGAVTVRTQEESKVIDKAYHSVTTKSMGSRLSAPAALSETQVNNEYANLLKAQPTHAVSFLVYFVNRSSQLTPASLAMIPQVIAKISERSPTEISVIGHADTTGSDKLNQRLSLDRAKAVELLLKGSMVGPNPISVKWFGSHDLLIATPPNVSEPRNRRVEIYIL